MLQQPLSQTNLLSKIYAAATVEQVLLLEISGGILIKQLGLKSPTVGLHADLSDLNKLDYRNFRAFLSLQL